MQLFESVVMKLNKKEMNVEFFYLTFIIQISSF